MHQLAEAVGLVEKEIAVAQRLLCVLADRNGDRLDMLIAVAFTLGPLPQFSKRMPSIGSAGAISIVPRQTATAAVVIASLFLSKLLAAR
jgi:hypothetical protein